MSTLTTQEKWSLAADHVLAVLLAEEVVHQSFNRYEKLRYEAGIEIRHFPAGYHQEVFRVLDELRLTGQSAHQSIIMSRCTDTPQEWLLQRIALYSEVIDGSVFDGNVKALLNYGETNLLKSQLKQAENEVTQGTPRDKIILDLMTTLALSGGEVLTGETAETGARDFETYLAELPPRTLSTGVAALDQWTGGIGQDDVIALAAPYKMRKSTLARNIALHVAKTGGSVAVLMFESNRRMVIAQFVVMFAIQYLLRSGLYDAKGNNGYPLKWISAKDLVRERAGYKRWDKHKVAAIDYGIAEYRKLEKNLRIYDKSADGGGLHDLASAQRVMLRDKRLYGTDLTIIDHATQIYEPGSVYDRMQKIAPFLETFARRQKVALCVLAQLNEESVKGSHNEHSPGVKGGGDLPAAVDYLVKVLYREPDAAGVRHDDKMTLIMQLSRYGVSGADVREEISIDPASGLILKPTSYKGK